MSVDVESHPTILVVIPGAEGRRPVLKRVLEQGDVCVLVPSADIKRSAWAKAEVGEGRWIQLNGSATDWDLAYEAVQAWLVAGGSGRRVDGIMTYDDFATELCAALGERLKLPCTPVSTIQMLRDKACFRQRCADVGLPAVRRATICSDGDIAAVLNAKLVPFPAVLKPRKGGGSWYVRKVESEAELRALWDELFNTMSQGFFPDDIIKAGFTLEEYFPGHEVDVDGWARNGKVEFSIVSDNRPAIEPFFLEIGGIYPSQMPSAGLEKINELTQRVVDAFPGIHTCFHFEAKINLDTFDVMPIEFNARLGGAECPASVEAVTGYYLPTVAACLALDKPCERGEKLHAVVSSTNHHRFETGVLAECSDEGVDQNGTKVITSVLFTGGVGKRHVPNNGSMSCLGWLATGGESFMEAEDNLQRAISQLCIRIEGESSPTL